MNFISAFRHTPSSRAPITPLLIRASAFSSSSQKKGKADIEESQGHVIDPANKHKQDVQSESVDAGGKARSKTNESIDAASPKPKQKPRKAGSGNPEGVGFVEQVGGATATAQHFESGGNEGSKTGPEKK